MELFHVLNRGVDKRDICLDNRDRARFIHDLFEFNDVEPALNNGRLLSRPNSMIDVGRQSLKRKAGVETKRRELLVHIHAFCLMPNHYHLLLSPVIENGISLFMKKLNGGYAKYFNERYNRTGALFQGKYKSVHVTSDSHFLYLPFYIHFNPLDLTNPEWREHKIVDTKAAHECLKAYRWSSHLDYLGTKNFPSITYRDLLLDVFGGERGYKRHADQMLLDRIYNYVNDVALE